MSRLTIDEQVDRIIDREIWCCDSMLIDMLTNGTVNDMLQEGFDLFEDVENLYDYSVDTIREYLEHSVNDDAVSTSDWVNLTSNQLLEFANDHGFEPEPQEIFEWYRVSVWLANHLVSINEPVLVNEYGNWWGRTCTGQHIKLDGTLQKIAETL